MEKLKKFQIRQLSLEIIKTILQIQNNSNNITLLILWENKSYYFINIVYNKI